MRNHVVIAMQEGLVHFGGISDAALNEVAAKQAVVGVDRTIIISKLRTRILNKSGTELRRILEDLHDAAMRHGAADDVVVLTEPR